MKRNIYITISLILLFSINDIKGQGLQYNYCAYNIWGQTPIQNGIMSAPTTLGNSSSIQNMWGNEWVRTTLTAGNTYKISASSAAGEIVFGCCGQRQPERCTQPPSPRTGPRTCSLQMPHLGEEGYLLAGRLAPSLHRALEGAPKCELCTPAK